MSLARASASSGVCLYLKVSRAPDAGAAAALEGFEAAAAGGNFLTGGAALALGCEGPAGGLPYGLNMLSNVI